jgi:hypothetical protein
MATPANMPISIRLDRDFILSVTELTDEGNPWDLRGMKIAFAIKGNITDPDSRALFLTEHFYTSDLAFGHYSFRVPLSATSGSGWSSTASASFEVVYQDPTGITQTRLEGPVAIGPSVLVTVP